MAAVLVSVSRDLCSAGLARSGLAPLQPCGFSSFHSCIRGFTPPSAPGICDGRGWRRHRRVCDVCDERARCGRSKARDGIPASVSEETDFIGTRLSISTSNPGARFMEDWKKKSPADRFHRQGLISGELHHKESSWDQRHSAMGPVERLYPMSHSNRIFCFRFSTGYSLVIALREVINPDFI